MNIVRGWRRLKCLAVPNYSVLSRSSRPAAQTIAKQNRRGGHKSILNWVYLQLIEYMVVALIFMPKAFFKGSSVWLFRRLSKPKRNLQHVPCKFVNRRCSKSPVLPGVSVMQRKFCMFVILAASADTFCHCKSARSWQMELLLYKVSSL